MRSAKGFKGKYFSLVAITALVGCIQVQAKKYSSY